MTYYINIENTGLDSHEQAEHVTSLLIAKEHDVKFTRDIGRINRDHTDDEFPFGGERAQDWVDAVEASENI